MYASLMLAALAGLPVLANAEDASSWQTDYVQARKTAQEAKKPLAVFVSTGKEGYNKLARDGKLGTEIENVLADKYVSVYIDSSTDAGRKLSSALGLESGMGLVISDRSGDLMAFFHEGDLFNQTMSGYLTRFADPSLVVRGTVTNPGPGGHGGAGCAGGVCGVSGGVGCASCGTGGYGSGCSSGGCSTGGCSSGGCGGGECHGGHHKGGCHGGRGHSCGGRCR